MTGSNKLKTSVKSAVERLDELAASMRSLAWGDDTGWDRCSGDDCRHFARIVDEISVSLKKAMKGKRED